MRTLRLSTLTMIILALLGGLAGAAMSQDRQGTTTRVTGESPGGRAVSEGTSVYRDGVVKVRNAVFEHEMKWSDPRLPSLMRVAENSDWRGLGDDSGVAIATVSSVRLDGPAGSWTGLEHGLIEELEAGNGVSRFMVLSGEGAYEGLSAMLSRTYEMSDYGKPVFEGYIFDDALAPMPDMPEPFDQSRDQVLEGAIDDEDATGMATDAEDASKTIAGAEIAGPAWVTGTVTLARCSGMTSISQDDVQHERGYVCGPQTWATSDPRLTGSATLTWNADVYESAEGTISLSAGTYDVRSDSGGWLCHYTDGVAHGSGMFSVMDSEPTLTCAGDGANEGLSAMLMLDWTSGPPNLPLTGLIFAGDAPPLPATTAE